MEVTDFRFDNAIANYKGLPHQKRAIAFANTCIVEKAELNKEDFEQFVTIWRTPDKSDASTTLQTSQRGIDLIKEFEGCELEAYPDPGTGGDPWTIGYGHTGSDVYACLTITQEKAEQLLSEDLKYFEKGILGCISVPLNQNQFDALVSFAYNLGVGALAESTLARLLNEGNYEAAADQFELWVNAGDEPMPGLVSRRHVEKELFLSA